MTFEEYRELAQRTASTKTKEDKIGHGVLGLIGEAGEIVDIIKKQTYMGLPEETAKAKILDEAGDWLWYMAELCTGLDADLEKVMRNVTRDTLIAIVGCEALAVYLIVRSSSIWTEYAVAFDGRIDAGKIGAAVAAWYSLVISNDLTVQEVMEHNIAKLRARYPEGFDAERSNRRYEG